MWYIIITIIVIYLILTFGLRFWTIFSLKRKATLLESSEFERQSKNGQIIDLRDSSDFKKKHVLGSRNIPIQYLIQNDSVIRKDKTVYFVDSDNKAAERITRKLKKEGYTDIVVLKGGISKYTGKTK